MNPKFQNLYNQAEEQYSSADGYMDEFAFDDSFAYNSEPTQYASADGDGDYAMRQDNRLYAEGQGQPMARTIPDFDRTFTITLTNTIAVDTAITIFGADQFLTAVNFGLPATVTVAVGESTYQEMLFETQTRPFIISGFRMTSATAAQLDQVLTILKRDANGQRAQYPLQVGNYFSAFQFQATIREVYPYNITFTGATQIAFTLLASATLTFVLFVGKRVNTDNTLHNLPIREVSVHKLPFVARQQLALSPATVQALKG